ncbi:hypothetical protein PoB_002431900 [Plakobranchus ocellatus]|uniref:HAT C-terminal dimerisation domain-containing protein n=1 Tax=Plakobranchus ocellatus TaxID=259542 RepID=A0AAV3ZR61_9GAST|nr:hypothetical protein PoB_002431900 [Plakobranchus ocellatus]
MCNLLVLPHSSACVERVFSQMNLVKTPQANKLAVKTIADRLLAKQLIPCDKKSCYTWEPPKELIADVKDGKCSRRRDEELSEQRERGVVFHTGIEPDEEA